jgi:hypothetical protein
MLKLIHSIIKNSCNIFSVKPIYSNKFPKNLHKHIYLQYNPHNEYQEKKCQKKDSSFKNKKREIIILHSANGALPWPALVTQIYAHDPSPGLH